MVILFSCSNALLLLILIKVSILCLISNDLDKSCPNYLFLIYLWLRRVLKSSASCQPSPSINCVLPFSFYLQSHCYSSILLFLKIPYFLYDSVKHLPTLNSLPKPLKPWEFLWHSNPIPYSYTWVQVALVTWHLYSLLWTYIQFMCWGLTAYRPSW